MNIFMVTKPISPFWNEGSKNLAFNLCTHIKNHKFHLMVCKSAKLPKADNIIYDPVYPDSALDTSETTLFNKIRLFYKIFNKKDIDVYHFIFTPRVDSSLIANLFFKLSKKKSIQTVSTPLKKSELKKCLFADKIVVLSEWTKNMVLSLGYKNVVKINPGIDLDKFSKNKTRKVRERFSISKDDFVILFPSEYDAKRGVRIILNVFKRLISEFPRTKLIFACRIKYKENLKEKKILMKIVNDLNLNSNVIFLDQINCMPELINSSDIVVFPLISPVLKMEIPMVLLESLALEKPIIISDIPPLNETFSESKCGIKIKQGDSESLLNSIINLIKNKELRDKMGKEGRKLVEEEYDIENVAKEYKKLYEELK